MSRNHGSPSDTVSTLYYYVNGETTLEIIEKDFIPMSNEVNLYTEVKEGTMGQGVYFTTLDPKEVGIDSHIMRDYNGLALPNIEKFIARHEKKNVECCIEIKITEIPGVVTVPGVESVWFYPGDLKLGRVDYDVNYFSTKG